MKQVRNKMVALTVAMFGVAAVLGGTLGMATAGTKDLGAGYNQIGGPVSSSVDADHYVACLAPASWKAMYIWQSSTQEWKHYFNTTKGVPAYVNNTAAGGMNNVPFGAGVIIIMEQAVTGAYFPDSNAQDCP